MECGECGIRSSVGYCHECEVLLCEVCSQICERCKNTVCKSHIQRTSSGRRICVSCVVHHYDKRAKKTKERREMRAEAVVAGDKKSAKKKTSGITSSKATSAAPAAESFSFESLQADMGGVPFTLPTDTRDPELFSPLVDKEALNQRVLTGSASTAKPAWLSGLLLLALAWVVFVGALTGGSFGAQRTIFNAVAVILSLGTVAWTASGALAKGNKQLRKRNRIVFALGLITFLFAGLVLYLRMTVV